MEIELKQPTLAQKFDDDGDPVGRLITLQPGKYRLRSGLREVEGEDGMRAWVSSGRTDVLYEARGLKPSI